MVFRSSALAGLHITISSQQDDGFQAIRYFEINATELVNAIFVTSRVFALYPLLNVPYGLDVMSTAIVCLFD